MIVLLFSVAMLVGLVSLCCVFYFLGRCEAEQRMTPFRDPRIDLGEIIEIKVTAKDYIQLKRIKQEDLENPERMAEVGRCLSFFYRTVDKL